MAEMMGCQAHITFYYVRLSLIRLEQENPLLALRKQTDMLRTVYREGHVAGNCGQPPDKASKQWRPLVT